VWSIICSECPPYNTSCRPKRAVELYLCCFFNLGTLPLGKRPGPIVQEAGWALGPVWTCVENLSPAGIRSQDCPACSKSLYQLHCPNLPIICLYSLQDLLQDQLFVYHVMIISQCRTLIYLCFTYSYLKWQSSDHTGRTIMSSCSLSRLISDAVVFAMPSSPVTLINGIMASFLKNFSFIHHTQCKRFIIHFTSAAH
jgi:hypothetical protein